MTSTTLLSAATGAAAPSERRLPGLFLIAGAALIGVLIEGGVLAFSWFPPPPPGLTYLAAAAVSRSPGTLWAPGLIAFSAGLAAAPWLRSGRPADSFEFLALAVMALGLGGVPAAGIGQILGWHHADGRGPVRAAVRPVRPARAAGDQADRRDVVDLHRAAWYMGGVRAASGSAALSC